MVTADQQDSLRGLKIKMMAFTTAERPPSPRSSCAALSQRELAVVDFQEGEPEKDSSEWGDSCSESSIANDTVSPMPPGNASVSLPSEGTSLLETIEAVFSKACTTIKAPELVSRSAEIKMRTSEIDTWMENNFQLEKSVIQEAHHTDLQLQAEGEEDEKCTTVSTSEENTPELVGNSFCLNEKRDDLINRLRNSLSLPSKQRTSDEKDDLTLYELRALQKSREATPSTGRRLSTNAWMETTESSDDNGRQPSKSVSSYIVSKDTSQGAVVMQEVPKDSPDTYQSTSPSLNESLASDVKGTNGEEHNTVRYGHDPSLDDTTSPKVVTAGDSRSSVDGLTIQKKNTFSTEDYDFPDNIEPEEFIDHLTKKSSVRVANLSKPRELNENDPEIMKGCGTSGLCTP